MGDNENDPREQAADPPSEHETPGGNPVVEPAQPETDVQVDVTVEQPESGE